MATKEVFRLVLFDELADRLRSGMNPSAHAIEFGFVRRCVADQHQRRERDKRLEAPGDILLAVFAGRIEGRGTRIAQPRDVPIPYLAMPLGKIVHSELFAKR